MPIGVYDHSNNPSVFKKGYKFSEEIVKKMNENRRRGKDHPCWRGGITTENTKIRTSLEYIAWREDVIRRDHNTCVFCGYYGDKLNADHIKPFSKYPELRFEVNNGRTLCEDCHIEYHKVYKEEYKKLDNYFCL